MEQTTYNNQPDDLRFTSRRSPVLATRGMVACSHPLAAEAGLSILKAGGNAVDAAVAVAAALAVCEPCSTGLGGDAFLLRYDAATQQVEGLNGSGRAPRALSIDRVKQDCGEGLRSVPLLHPHAVTVPGAAAAWCDAIERWGSLPLHTVLEPAVRLAEEGFPVTPIIAYQWHCAERDLRQQRAAEGDAPGDPGLLVADAGAPGGARAPRVGELWRNAAMASVLRELGSGGKAAFYEGRVARAIVAAVRARGGVMADDDLREHGARGSTCDPPLRATYHGVDVWECAPNGQGLTALLALSILDGLAPPPGAHAHGSAAHLHPLIEALRLAFADGRWFVADPEHAPAPTDALLGAAYVATRRALLDPHRATADPKRGAPRAQSNTVSFQAATPAPRPSAPPQRPAPAPRPSAPPQRPAPALSRSGASQVVDGAGNAVSMVNSNCAPRHLEPLPPPSLAALPGRAPRRRARGRRRLRHRHRPRRLRLLAAEPRRQLLARRRPPQPARGRQAALPHDHPRARHARRRAVRELHQHGRLHAAAGPRAAARQHGRLRHGPAGRHRRAALLHRRRQHRRRGGAAARLPRGGARRGDGGAAPPDGPRHRARRQRPPPRRLRQGADHPPHAHRRALGGLRGPGRRLCHGLLRP